MFEKAFPNLPCLRSLSCALTVAAGLAGYFLYRRKTNGGRQITKKSQWTTKELTTAALCIGASFLLSFIKVFSMPNGGSHLTPAVARCRCLHFPISTGLKKAFICGTVLWSFAIRAGAAFPVFSAVCPRSPRILLPAGIGGAGKKQHHSRYPIWMRRTFCLPIPFRLALFRQCMRRRECPSGSYSLG